MDLRELIELGNKKAGEQKALADFLGLAPTQLTDAKAGRRGLPDFACFRLAKLLEMNPAIVTAASALATEKDEERRKVFYPFVMGRAAAIALATALIGTAAVPENAQANQSHNPLPANGNWHYVKLFARMVRRFMFQFRMPLVFSFA